MNERFYNVAGHVFSLNAGRYDNVISGMQAYEPFAVAPSDALVFSLRIADKPFADEGVIVEMRQQDEGQEIVVGRLQSGKPQFEFWLHGSRAAVLITSRDYRQGDLYLEGDHRFGINNALMVIYALATADKHTALFHSSVVSCRGRGYMFLGVSGTGKSTHSCLWLKHIDGTELVNDDNPVVRILDKGEVRVFGSPWSGKTPCYRNVSYPLRALVDLRQAPENRIWRLNGIEAYIAIALSVSGKRWERRLADGIHETENLLAQMIPVWHLDCLPDGDAARLCCSTCSGGEL